MGVPTFVVLGAVLLAAGGVTTVVATSSSMSDNYEVTEMQFGSGSSVESCSDEYCSRVSIGGMGGGEAASSGSGENKVVFGDLTPGEPTLEVIVGNGVSNLGKLTTETTATKTMTVQVRNYLSEGYTLQISGDAPKYGGHTLTTPNSPTASTPGTEQFGINVVANTDPEIGENIQQHPSSDFSFGEVMADYDTPNMFMYNSGDVIARSLVESGRTDYTISMVVNISNATPAGNYNGDFSAVVIPIF